MSKLYEKTVIAIHADKIEQILARLRKLGFERITAQSGPLVPWTYRALNPQATIQRVLITRDELDPDNWFILSAFAKKPFAARGVVVVKRVAEKRRDELEQAMRQATAYYRQTILPYVQRPMVDSAEWGVAKFEHDKLRQAVKAARDWNLTPARRGSSRESNEFAIKEEAFPNLHANEFDPPQLLHKDETLQKALESQSPPAQLSPAEVIRRAKELINEYEKLPQKPDLAWQFALMDMSVNFGHILRSNETEGHLPLLPPVKADGPAGLTEEAIKKLAEELCQAYLAEFFSRYSWTWHPGCIPLVCLSDLRRQRFEEHGHAPELVARLRRISERQEPEQSFVVAEEDLARIVSQEMQKVANGKQSELAKVKAELKKAKDAANLTLKEALKKWMRFDPPAMRADTRARIEKAVKFYITDPEMRSFRKVAAEFKVSHITVSRWFKAFSDHTGFQVVTHVRHESVQGHLRAQAEQKRSQGDSGESCSDDHEE